MLPLLLFSLILSGAGFNWFNQIGALIQMESCLDFDQVGTFAGTSAGAYLSTHMALGMKPSDMPQWYVDNYDTLTNLLSLNPADVPINMGTYGSMFDPNIIVEFLSLMVNSTPVYQQHFSHIPAAQLTFAMVAPYAKNLIISVTNMTTGEPAILSVETTPDLPLVTAVQASMTVIPLTPPVIINGQGYLDGCYTHNMPFELYNPTSQYYYKNIYPAVDLPIDLFTAYGVNYASPIFQSPPLLDPWAAGVWGYLPQLINFGVGSQTDLIEDSLFYQLRTVALTGYETAAWPSESTMLAMIASGTQQAQQQCHKVCCSAWASK